jgi:hypothetical protein
VVDIFRCGVIADSDNRLLLKPLLNPIKVVDGDLEGVEFFEFTITV